MQIDLLWCRRPLLLRGWASPRIQDDPISRDPVDTGVDLRIDQLLGEGTVGTTWLRIYPHGHHLMAERLNPVAKKGTRPSALPAITIG
jgi:hypothetical protein